MPGAERRARVAELLGSVGLGERLEHLPSQLSGGEQQRVAIARALANRPDVLLADEPTGNLDTATGEEIMAVLRELNAGGLTIVLITHDPEIAGRAGRLVRLRDGRIDARRARAARAKSRGWLDAARRSGSGRGCSASWQLAACGGDEPASQQTPTSGSQPDATAGPALRGAAGPDRGVPGLPARAGRRAAQRPAGRRRTA